MNNSGVSLFGFNFQYFGKIKDEENKYQIILNLIIIFHMNVLIAYIYRDKQYDRYIM